MAIGFEINIASLEWENFDSWEICSLEASEHLPPGAEKVEVWRDENYALQAKIFGTTTSSLHRLTTTAKLPPGSLLPQFELKGSGAWGMASYELGSCSVGDHRAKKWDREANPPIMEYEADLYTSGVRVTTADRGASETESQTEWFSEWYLNGSRSSRTRLFPRASNTDLEGRYIRRRGLPNNEEESFEASKTITGALSAFIETDQLSFLVQRVPEEFRPHWSECLAIEYRPSWGGIPSEEDREAIARIVSFVMGRELIKIGYTRFDKEGLPLEQVALHPSKENLVFLCQRAVSYPPIHTSILGNEGGIEPILRSLVPNYLELKNDLRINEALEALWVSKEVPIGFNLPILGSRLEALAKSWFKSTRTKTEKVYIRDEDLQDLLKEEFASAEAKLQGHKYKEKILERMCSNYSLSVNDLLRFFFNEIGLLVGDSERKALEKRNPMAHGRSSVFDPSSDEEMIKATIIYQTLFHRILLKLLDYQGAYIDYGTLGQPSRPINQPSGET